MIETSTRNATLQDLADLLQAQRGQAHDLIVPASSLESYNGVIHVPGAEQRLTVDGVDTVDGVYRPTAVADEHLADRTGIPVRYLRRMREQRPDLYDANVNGWLHGCVVVEGDAFADRAAPDARRFLLRTFSAQDGSEGILRAVLSDSYKVIDNLDVLLSVLSALRESGHPVDIRSADLSERRMVVKINAPGITALAPVLLAGYRSPFGNADVEAARRFGNVAPDTEEIGRVGNAPIVSAGIRISNSEVGAGAFTVTPEILVLACTNGIVRTVDVMRNIHSGAKLDEGIIQWSDATRRANLELVKRQTVDAVGTFLNPDYLAKVIAEVEAKAGVPLTGTPSKAIEVVGKALAWSEAEQEGILAHFAMGGGQLTRGGVLNAVTSFSQTVPSSDRADELDSAALKVLDLAV
jgi:hypothetical protein